jgi:hypothetical protein
MKKSNGMGERVDGDFTCAGGPLVLTTGVEGIMNARTPRPTSFPRQIIVLAVLVMSLVTGRAFSQCYGFLEWGDWGPPQDNVCFPYPSVNYSMVSVIVEACFGMGCNGTTTVSLSGANAAWFTDDLEPYWQLRVEFYEVGEVDLTIRWEAEGCAPIELNHSTSLIG